MARPDVLNRLKELGWDGPTSYTLPYLQEMISHLEGGMTVEDLKASRKKTSSPEVKGNGRAPKGEWVPVDGNDSQEGDRPIVNEAGEVTGYERFVPTPKPVKVKAEKGEWVTTEWPDPNLALPPLGEEIEINGDRWRHREVDAEAGMGVTEKFVPTPKKVGKLKGEQQASFDPREMLRAFENEDMRVRTGGRDWTMIDVDWLDGQLKEAQGRGDAAVLVDVGGSKETCDVVWLEALVAVKRRLALREENGDAPADAGGA